ncbi:MAG: hypothetical protein ABI359_09055 [Ginsengibacter sp.]
MRNFLCFLFLSLIVVLFGRCHSQNNSIAAVTLPADSVHIFPVTSFLKGQLKMLDTMPVTPLRTISENGKTDSTWLKREDIRKNAGSFLVPVIDSASMISLFTEKSFLDQTLNAYTFSYDPKVKLPDSVHLVHWDVYMNPQTNEISRIYLVKENADTTTQLTWLVNKWYSIRTIVQPTGKKPQVKEEKMTWGLD